MITEESSTSRRLMDVAERLFAQQGINSTLVSEIVLGAGQRNPSALRYHFGSRDGVLRAITQRHQEALENRRAVLLSRWPAPGPVSAHDAARLIVQPLADLLGFESGRHYLCILGQIIDQLDVTGTGDIAGDHPSLVAALELMKQHVPDQRSAVVTERMRAVLLMITTSLAARATTRISGARVQLSDDRLRDQLIAMAAAALTTDLPEE